MSLEDPRWLWWLLVLAALLPALFVSRRFFGRGAAVVMAVLRTVVVVCLVLAAAGLSWNKPVNSRAVMLLVDHSHSIDPAESSRRDAWVNQALSTAGRGRRLGVISFGERPVAAALPSASPQPVEGVAVGGEETDIEAALRHAMLYLPDTGRRRVVLLSDGLSTRGRPVAAAADLAAADIEIGTVTLQPQRSPDVAVVSLDAPARRKEKEPVRLTITLDAEEAQEGVLRFYEDGQPIAAERVDLPKGVSRMTLDRIARQGGFHTYEVVFEAPADAFRANNRQGAFTYVEGPDRVLLAQGEGGADSPLAVALKAQGLEVTVTSGAVPGRAEDLVRYDSLVLDNVAASLLEQDQMALMQEMVHGLGRGLVMTGGKDSFGPGGYYGTPIADALPVDMRLSTKRKVPSLAIVFAVDKSGSMGGADMGGPQKIALAREAVTLALDLIFPGDIVGVVGFDSAAKWVVPPEPMQDRRKTAAMVRTLRAGGGTHLYPALAQALEQLQGAKAMYKHVVVLSDGMTNPADFETLMQGYRDAKITLSTVGMGADADRNFLTDLAKLGEGRSYFPTSARNLPQLYTRETTLAYRAYLVQETFTPVTARHHAITGGTSGYPPLHGYTGTSPKPAAQHLLITHKKDPLLSAWQHGIGRAVAFTSDTGQRWAKDWLGWQGFGPLFSQMVRWTSGRGAVGAARLGVHADGAEGLVVSVEARDEDGREPLDAALDLHVLGPEGETQQVRLHRVGGGHYKGRLKGSRRGLYIGRASNATGTLSAVVGAYVGGGAEYAHRLTQESVLGQLAAVTGGRELHRVEEMWENIAVARPEEVPLWPWLVAVAAALWLVDVALRRFHLSSRAVQEAVRHTAGHAVEALEGGPPVAVATPKTMDALLKSKQSHTERSAQRAGLGRRASETGETS